MLIVQYTVNALLIAIAIAKMLFLGTQQRRNHAGHRIHDLKISKQRQKLRSYS